jgi:hypothetical protein
MPLAAPRAVSPSLLKQPEVLRGRPSPTRAPPTVFTCDRPKDPAAVACWEDVPLLDGDSLHSIALHVDEWDVHTLGSGASTCSSWRAAFGPCLAALKRRLQDVGLDGPIFSLPLRLQQAIIDAESDELLRRPTLWKERRRALLASLDTLDLRELHELTQPPPGVAEALNAALTLAWRPGCVAEGPTTATAPAARQATTQGEHLAPVAKDRRPVPPPPTADGEEEWCTETGSLSDWGRCRQLLSRAWASPSAGAMATTTARDADESAGAAGSPEPTTELLSLFGAADRHIPSIGEHRLALVRPLSREDWFHPRSLEPRAADVLVRWTLAVLDEAEFFAMWPESREAAEQLRCLRQIESELRERWPAAAELAARWPRDSLRRLPSFNSLPPVLQRISMETK